MLRDKVSIVVPTNNTHVEGQIAEVSAGSAIMLAMCSTDENHFITGLENCFSCKGGPNKNSKDQLMHYFLKQSLQILCRERVPL